jgi:hypothetical protein
MMAEVRVHDLELAIWLVSGLRPKWTVRWLGELAAFPSAAPTHEARSIFERADEGLSPVARLDQASVRAAYL